jgi:hypothetical protein
MIHFFLAGAAAAHASTRKQTIVGSERTQVNADCKNTRKLVSLYDLTKPSSALAFCLYNRRRRGDRGITARVVPDAGRQNLQNVSVESSAFHSGTHAVDRAVLVHDGPKWS